MRTLLNTSFLIAQRKALLVAAASTVGVALLVWAAVPSSKPAAVDLATELPQGALMTLSSPDFGGLLKSWNTSPEQTAWLKSANYSAFANSRLFGRLNDALAEFSTTANSTLDTQFLQQVAGKESIFAWYDIGNLEFVYITHLPSGAAAKIDLLQQRGKYSRREAGGTTFYVRQSSAAATTDAADPSDAGSSAPSQPRTMAFAVRGDWLVLATREDLMAGALTLMQSQGTGTVSPASQAPSASQATESWYAAASAADADAHGDLHMVIDLKRIVATPYFRTYWVQQNITAMKQYASAAVDLYRDPTGFREERVLLPATPVDASAAAAQPDLAPLESLVPVRAGVYRIVTNPAPSDALASLQEKLLTRSATASTITTSAPAADLSTPHAGSSTDLESRIDTPDPVAVDPSAASSPLLTALTAANLNALLTVDRTDPPAPGQLFVSIHSAVILRAASKWNSQQLASVVLDAIRSRLTAGGIGAAWKTVTTPEGPTLVISDAQPFALFIDGNLAILATDPAMLNDILAQRKAAALPASSATLIAGFRHQQERASFARLATAVDYDVSTAAPAATASDRDASTAPDAPTDAAAAAPTFLNGNIRSLGDAFSALATERLVERRDATGTHQTVIYTWQPK